MDAEGSGESLRRVARLLTEIEQEAVRLVDGSRGASALSIVSRAASALRYLDGLLEQEPRSAPMVVAVEEAYVRRIRQGVHELKLSAAAAANLVGMTEEEIVALLHGFPGDLPLDLLERAARRLESEQQLALESLVQTGVGAS